MTGIFKVTFFWSRVDNQCTLNFLLLNNFFAAASDGLKTEIATSMTFVPGCAGLPVSALLPAMEYIKHAFLPPLCAKYFDCIFKNVTTAFTVIQATMLLACKYSIPPSRRLPARSPAPTPRLPSFTSGKARQHSSRIDRQLLHCKCVSKF